MRSSVSNKVIILFIDGVGLGSNDPEKNPCCHSDTGIFLSNNQLPENGQKFALDAQMGVSGLPQSATGHTTLYTGINAPGLIEKHLTGFPNKELRNLLKTKSVFIQLKKSGYTCKFINAFRPVFFTTPEIFANLHMSATTEMNRYANYDFSNFSDIREERALYHDYSNKENIEKGFDLPIFSAQKAASILNNQSKKYNLILYEYFLTDFAGHAQDLNRSVNEIKKIEDIILALIGKIDKRTTTLIVVSDHGNIEDLSTKSHTTNPAFLGIWDAQNAADSFVFKDLRHIFPYVIHKITGKMPVSF